MSPCRVRQCLGAANRLTRKGCFEKGTFWHSSNHIFRRQELQKCLSCEPGLFLKNAQNFM